MAGIITTGIPIIMDIRITTAIRTTMDLAIMDQVIIAREVLIITVVIATTIGTIRSIKKIECRIRFFLSSRMNAVLKERKKRDFEIVYRI